MNKATGSRADQVFRREGEYWTIVYGGMTVRLRDAIGLHYLACLLARPHRCLSASSLEEFVKGRSAGDAQRARSAVSKRIRDAVRRVELHHPTLGYHLRAGITTGASCMYVPDPQSGHPWVT